MRFIVVFLLSLVIYEADGKLSGEKSHIRSKRCGVYWYYGCYAPVVDWVPETVTKMVTKVEPIQQTVYKPVARLPPSPSPNVQFVSSRINGGVWVGAGRRSVPYYGGGPASAQFVSSTVNGGVFVNPGDMVNYYNYYGTNSF